MPDCPSCGNAVTKDARFCKSCGADVANATAVMSAARVVEEVGHDDPTDPGDPPAVDDDSTRVMPAAEQRICPNCAATNSARRMLCGRCGADLDTGEVAPRAVPPGVAAPAPTEPRASERDRATTARTVPLIIAIGILIGGTVGALAALRVGPFAADSTLPEVAFDQSRYEGEPDVLPVESIGTSTVLPASGEQRYDRTRMMDGDLTTAWNNSGDTNPDGIGEIIRLEFPHPVWVSELVLGNGQQQDGFSANGRLRRAQVRMDGDLVFEVIFLDRAGLQAVHLPDPVLTSAVRIEVLEAFPGDTYRDLAISELSLEGHVADEADAEVARDRARLAPTPT